MVRLRPNYRIFPSVQHISSGQDVNLPPVAEEVAGFYGAMLETPHAEDATFNKNFFKDFLDVLKKNPPVSIFNLSGRVYASDVLLARWHRNH